MWSGGKSRKRWEEEYNDNTTVCLHHLDYDKTLGGKACMELHVFWTISCKKHSAEKQLHGQLLFIWQIISEGKNELLYTAGEMKTNLSYLPIPSARAGYDSRSFFKRSLTGLNSREDLSQKWSSFCMNITTL